MLRRLPASFQNPLTLLGAAIAGVSFGLILFLMLLEFLAETPKPYMGIIAFVLLPGILIAGLAIAVFGIRREHRRRRMGTSAEHRLPQIDLNNPRHQTAFSLVSGGAILLLLFTAFGSFKAYEHTDSDAFCGGICHKVMEPEHTAYQYSPHARVGCVKCHIGSGAGWFVRSKLSGSYQMYAVAFNKYPRPIPTPIENLRPAQETCEQCHWPKHFYSEKLQASTYFTTGEQATKWTLDLLIRIGGGNIEAGPTSGIHWHMNLNNKVTYIPTDASRQSIPWVRSELPDGTVTVYNSTETPLSEAEVRTLPSRRMDCIDCHNRPSHIYHPPARSVNHLMTLGWIDPSLPNAKSIAVHALEGPYSSSSAATDSIKTIIEEFYSANFPAVASAKQAEIARMIEEVQKIYSRNYFPEMRVNWRAFPDNIGHLYYLGCFRCHDGKHVSNDGKVLSKDCNSCHAILAQQFERGALRISLEGIEYRHPVDVGNAWKETNCSECHNPAGIATRVPKAAP
ncbi:MAG TPA: NapC/NirT family cytochrome c [Gemmatimonadaceae bacterium]|nr:NapC/NirT family cytochrome c [Gemmatimonadaceae bacterium]